MNLTIEEQLAAAKGEISRLLALRNEGELNEKLKDCGEAAKLAVAGLIMFREDAEVECERYRLALEWIKNCLSVNGAKECARKALENP